MNLQQQASKMSPKTITSILKSLLAIFGIALFNSTSYADFHKWRISEIYTNGDGSMQYIELFTEVDGQQNLLGHTISSSPGQVFTFPSNLSGSTEQRYILLATESFALLTGLSPDFVLPENFILPDGGILDFSGVHAVVYVGWNLPKNGSQSLETYDGNNIPSDPSPTNYFGDTVSINSNITASFDAASLRLNLPVVDVPNIGLANVTLLLSNDNPIEFTLSDFYLYGLGIKSASTAVTFTGSVLYIPALKVDGVYYELNLTLLNDDPVVFGSLEVLSLTELGAIDETSGEPTPIDVARTWTGPLVLDIEGVGLEGGIISFALTQNGSTISGITLDEFDDDPGTLLGSIKGNTLSLEWLTDDSSADCVPFKVQLVFAVSSTGLNLAGASGQLCNALIVTGGLGLLIAAEAAEVDVSGGN